LLLASCGGSGRRPCSIVNAAPDAGTIDGHHHWQHDSDGRPMERARNYCLTGPAPTSSLKITKSSDPTAIILDTKIWVVDKV